MKKADKIVFFAALVGPIVLGIMPTQLLLKIIPVFVSLIVLWVAIALYAIYITRKYRILLIIYAVATATVLGLLLHGLLEFDRMGMIV